MTKVSHKANPETKCRNRLQLFMGRTKSDTEKCVDKRRGEELRPFLQSIYHIKSSKFLGEARNPAVYMKSPEF